MNEDDSFGYHVYELGKPYKVEHFYTDYKIRKSEEVQMPKIEAVQLSEVASSPEITLTDDYSEALFDDHLDYHRSYDQWEEKKLIFHFLNSPYFHMKVFCTPIISLLNLL